MKGFRKWHSAAWLGVLLLPVLNGCSFFAPAVENIRIETEPREAIVIINGIKYVGTPVVLPMSCKHDVLIEAYVADKDGMPRGFRRNYVVRRTLSACGVLDTLGTIALLPGFGLLSGGAYTFYEHDVKIDLDDRDTNVRYVLEEDI